MKNLKNLFNMKIIKKSLKQKLKQNFRNIANWSQPNLPPKIKINPSKIRLLKAIEIQRNVYFWSFNEFILYSMNLPVPFKDSYNRTKKLLLRKKDKLTKLAEMLMKYETLDMEEIRLIMEGKDIVRSWLWAWL